MDKHHTFKRLAEAAFAPAPVAERAPQRAIDLSTSGLEGTERLKGARLIPIERLTTDPAQPRKAFSEKSLRELAHSIAQHGVLQPLTVTYHRESDRFVIVTGERRYRAAQRAGLAYVPCLILDELNERDRLYHQLVENLQREDITPFEEAEAFRVLVDKFHLTHQQIADLVAKSRSYVTKTLGLTRIPPSVRRLCAQRGIIAREALILLAQQKTETGMRALLDRLAHRGHDVRTMRKVARSSRSLSSRTRPFEFHYTTPRFTVRVRFTKQKASKGEIARALTAALKSLDEE